jgi:hypothetical protein
VIATRLGYARTVLELSCRSCGQPLQRYEKRAAKLHGACGCGDRTPILLLTTAANEDDAARIVRGMSPG